MFSLKTVPGARKEEITFFDEREYLLDRMKKPQRHRLLHGYPLAAAMRPRSAARGVKEVRPDPSARRGLLVGVLPHPFCNPAVTGCGFCTFPHEKYNADQAAEVVANVAVEVRERARRQPEIAGREVTALYFGGGTANLAPAGRFGELCRELTGAFDLRQAEITLEGVPAYFVKRRPLLVEVMRDTIPARHFRLSMGVQTFDECRLRQMGRQAFGDHQTFREVVELGHRMGFTVSADLLFNLPGQSLDEMKDDVRKAMDLGLDHLGLYHLVLFRGLGTEWARDPDMVAALPTNERAADNWVELRAMLIDGGFRQTTLTNFERNEFHGNPRRFLYEECTFQPDRYEVLGFGPSGISFAADRRFRRGLKTLNPEGAGEYVKAVQAGGPVWDRFFDYGARDLKVLYLTRRLAALEIDLARYASLFVFGREAMQDFWEELEVAREERLVEIFGQSMQPTPRGMFYADSVAALIGFRQVFRRRGMKVFSRRVHDNGFGHM